MRNRLIRHLIAWQSRRALSRLLVAAALLAFPSLTVTHAQTNDSQTSASVAWNEIPGINLAQLYTYYGDFIPKDGYLIVPTKLGGNNFVECDKSLHVIDVKTLQNSGAPDCNHARNDGPSMIGAYIKGLAANGDVQIVTRHGVETIPRGTWEALQAAAAKSGVDASRVKAGDFAAIEKDQNGSFAMMFKLAPYEGHD